MAQTLQTADSPVDTTYPIFSISSAIKLRLKHNFTYQMLADHYGMKKANVHKHLRSFTAMLDLPADHKIFDDVRKNILSNVEMKLLSKLVDDDTIKDASLNNAAYAYNVIYHANRLENDRSTANVNFSALIQSITAKNKTPDSEVN